MKGLNQRCCIRGHAWRGYLAPIAHPHPLRGRISPAQEPQELGSCPLTKGSWPGPLCSLQLNQSARWRVTITSNCIELVWVKRVVSSMKHGVEQS